VVIASVLIFAAEMIPCLWPRLGSGVAETGMFLGVCFLVLAAAIGLILGLDKTYSFLGGSVLTNLAGHVDFAALGWVTLTICAVSYRMLPAFLLAEIERKPPAGANWQLYSLAAGILGLGMTLIFAVPGTMFWSIAIAASLIAYDEHQCPQTVWREPGCTGGPHHQSGPSLAYVMRLATPQSLCSKTSCREQQISASSRVRGFQPPANRAANSRLPEVSSRFPQAGRRAACDRRPRRL